MEPDRKIGHGNELECADCGGGFGVLKMAMRSPVACHAETESGKVRAKRRGVDRRESAASP